MSRQDRIAQLMALLNDAESSGDDDKIIEIKSDIFKEFGIEKNMGGMASMDDMTRPVGYENGGNVTRRLSSTRAKKPFEDFLRDIGFTKKDEKTGKLRGAKGDWAKYLTSKNIKVGSAEATDELNNLLKAAGKPTYIDIKTAGKNFSEDIISAITGTEPGERGAREARNATNSKIVEIKKVATQAEGANSTKAKQKLLTTLFEKSFPVLKQVPKYATLLSTAIASKAFGYMPIATEMGSDDMPLGPDDGESARVKQRLMEENNITQEQINQIANQPIDLLAPRKNMGGMMNMNEMTMPLQSYEHGGMHITPKPKPKPKPELSFEQIKEMMLEEDKGSKDLSKLTLMEKIRSELEPVEGQTMNVIKQKIKPIRDKVNDFIKFGRGDKERFFGGATGTDFYLDDPSLIEFIKKRAGTNDENSKEYQNELIKFMDEVTPKKNMGGMMNMNDIIKPLRDN